MNIDYEHLEPWQRRVMDELVELDIKVKKLRAMLVSTQFRTLEEVDRDLLETQFCAMETYRRILEMRVKRFK